MLNVFTMFYAPIIPTKVKSQMPHRLRRTKLWVGRAKIIGRRLGHDLGFGIGIAHGFAALGTIGFEGRFDYAVIGMVVQRRIISALR